MSRVPQAGGPVLERWQTQFDPALRAAYRDNGPCHDYGHALRVAALAEHIARGEGTAADVPVLAALFHDAGHHEADQAGTDTHELWSAEFAAGSLRAVLAPGDLAAVVDAIGGRRFAKRHGSRSTAGAILDDADNLDALGLTGGMRAMLWLGEHGLAVSTGRHGPMSAPVTAITDHWEAKLSRLAAGMRTSTGRALGLDRHRALRELIDGLIREVEWTQTLAGGRG
jgi:uncharacterized protein